MQYLGVYMLVYMDLSVLLNVHCSLIVHVYGYIVCMWRGCVSLRYLCSLERQIKTIKANVILSYNFPWRKLYQLHYKKRIKMSRILSIYCDSFRK